MMNLTGGKSCAALVAGDNSRWDIKLTQFERENEVRSKTMVWKITPALLPRCHCIN